MGQAGRLNIVLITVTAEEVEFSAIRAQGAGGQNVNKVSNAVHLRFDVAKSTLPDDVKQRLLAVSDQRITADGVVVIKAQAYRSLEKNRADALARLNELVAGVAVPPRARKATRPSRNAKAKRVDAKVQRGQVKALRGKVKA